MLIGLAFSANVRSFAVLVAAPLAGVELAAVLEGKLRLAAAAVSAST